MKMRIAIGAGIIIIILLIVCASMKRLTAG